MEAAMYTWVNLTPHAITVIRGEGDLTVPASGTVARVELEKEAEGGTLEDGVIWACAPKPARLVGLPAPTPGTRYLVAVVCLPFAAGRDDVFAPDTGPGSVVRNAVGHVVAVRRLYRAPSWSPT